ncbi:MAG: SurA N-terminal domain-containing protein [Deltaproteobacteria bacterium]|jgi:hypothetical protein|nr:SurA N-terminal domain-containing protein [Deltaproteobacteria bacterium]
MLDLLRRHAKSWAIKVPIIAIIISFAFFFGYSAMRKGGDQGSDQAVATVNERPITAAEYNYYLDSNFERLRQNFTDSEVPEFLKNMAKSNTLRQLVSREMMLDEAEKLGITVSDMELADTIKRVQAMMFGGSFDPVFYKERYLPHFKNRYSLDYEAFVRTDIELDSLKQLFSSVGNAAPSKKGAKEETWTFGVVEIEPDKVEIAEEIIKTPTGKWASTLKKHKLKEKKHENIKLSSRKKLASGKLNLEEIIEVFKLSKDKPVLSKPVKKDDKIYVVRFIKKGESEAIDSPAGTMEFFRDWMSKLLADAKVTTLLEQEQQ